METFASSTKLLPEQVWALPDRPQSTCIWDAPPVVPAMPLAWAHAEYLKLVRSAADGQVFDTIAEVADRYRNRMRLDSPSLEIWKFNRQVRSIAAGGNAAHSSGGSLPVAWTGDGWRRAENTDSTSIGTGHEFVDVRVPLGAYVRQSTSPSSGLPPGAGKGGIFKSASII